jgi:hypothetical protein
MRSLAVCAIALAVAVILIAQPVAALPILQVPYVRAGPVWSLNPSEIANLVIIESNTSHLAASNSEALAISFAPAPGCLAIAPVIAQTSARTIACDRSYFFQDFIVP